MPPQVREKAFFTDAEMVWLRQLFIVMAQVRPLIWFG